MRWIIFRGRFPQKTPIIIGFLAKNDLQLKATKGSSPPSVVRHSLALLFKSFSVVNSAKSWHLRISTFRQRFDSHEQSLHFALFTTILTILHLFLRISALRWRFHIHEQICAKNSQPYSHHTVTFCSQLHRELTFENFCSQIAIQQPRTNFVLTIFPLLLFSFYFWEFIPAYRDSTSTNFFLWLCMCVYAYTYVYMHIHICICKFTYVYEHIYLYIYKYIYICI